MFHKSDNPLSPPERVRIERERAACFHDSATGERLSAARGPEYLERELEIGRVIIDPDLINRKSHPLPGGLIHVKSDGENGRSSYELA